MLEVTREYGTTFYRDLDMDSTIGVIYSLIPYGMSPSRFLGLRVSRLRDVDLPWGVGQVL